MSDVGETLQDRQEEEVHVLQSIYDKEFEDLRDKDVWKVHRPPEFHLKLVFMWCG